jgi:hypothetical protein
LEQGSQLRNMMIKLSTAVRVALAVLLIYSGYLVLLA